MELVHECETLDVKLRFYSINISLMIFKTFRIGGIHPEENKITAEIKTFIADIPRQAFFRCHSI